MIKVPYNYLPEEFKNVENIFKGSQNLLSQVNLL